MGSCSAFSCTNRSENYPAISFHRIPSSKKKELRQKWLHNIRVGNLPSDKSFYIEENCFKRDLQVIGCLVLFVPFPFYIKKKITAFVRTKSCLLHF